MPGIIFILEDNPARLVEMHRVLDRIEDDCASAVDWLTHNQASVDLISLDHDLDSVPRPGEDRSVDHGCGRGVVDHLEIMPPTCPVIIHTSNADAGDGMYFALHRAGWLTLRVYPADHHGWIEREWAEEIRKLKLKGWI